MKKQIAIIGMLTGIVGCAKTVAVFSGNKPTTTTAPTTQASLMDTAKALIAKGEALLAKGKSDNDPSEQSEGQKLIDEGKALLQKYKLMGS